MDITAGGTYPSWQQHCGPRVAFRRRAFHFGRKEYGPEISSQLESNENRPWCDFSCLSRARHHARQHELEHPLKFADSMLRARRLTRLSCALDRLRSIFFWRKHNPLLENRLCFIFYNSSG